MRAAFLLSALMHAAILLAAIVTLPSGDAFETAPVAALPVELVSIEETTDITVGEVDAQEIVEDAAPETVEAEAPPEPGEQPGASGLEADTIATEEDAIISAEESAAPEPEGVPDPEPEPEERSEEPAEVASVEPPAPEPEPVPEPAAEPAPREPILPPDVLPRARPTPPPRQARVERAAESFDADRLSQLINRTNPTGGGSGASRASIGSDAGRANASLTLSEMDALRAQMQRCWNPPIGLAGAEELVITVQIRLNPDGTVETIEEVGAAGIGRLYDVAADAARRAVIQCQPYSLPPQKYDVWKDVQVNFDPRELF